MRKNSVDNAQVRVSGFLRRGVWQLRHGECKGPAVALLLLLAGSLGVLSLLVANSTDLPAIASISSLRGKMAATVAAGKETAMRSSGVEEAVILDGRKLQRPLRASYPNGDANRFQCDLPSLRFQCELDGETGCQAYPQLFPAGQLFENWSPTETTRPPKTLFDSICHFNVSSPYELRLAQMFREMEVPFVAYGVPELSAATERWSDAYLSEQLDPEALYKVHVANSSHFMYYRKNKAKAGEEPTYDSRWMTYPQFVEAVAATKPLEKAGEPHEYYYLMLKKPDFLEKASFVYDELPFLNPLQTSRDPRFGDLFLRDMEVAQQRGMRCRLGMRGIIAEGHIDGGLNMVAMVRGTKRYVISPPSVCGCLGLLTSGQSTRHTALDWGDVSQLPEDARKCPAAEVALTAGEVLYLPSYWYHHIVSMDTSIQCNQRSGLAVREDTRQFLTECGFPNIQ